MKVLLLMQMDMINWNCLKMLRKNCLQGMENDLKNIAKI